MQFEYLKIDFEISIISGLNGQHPSTVFNPQNPFLKTFYRPLPFMDYSNKFYSGGFNNIDLYTVVEEEFTVDPPSLNLKKVFNCFNRVASIGATYKIKLCVDIPNNKHPMYLPLLTGSETGHSFIVLTKSNGAKTVTQVFGFYSQKHPGYLFPFRELPSVVKNNQLREINASIEMNLTEAQFEIIRNKAFELAKRKYALARYNCSNFGVDLLNSVRAKPLTVDPHTIYLPTNVSIYGVTEVNKITVDVTVQTLFKKLNEMKNSKDPEASCITIDQSHNSKAPLSSGECDF